MVWYTMQFYLFMSFYPFSFFLFRLIFTSKMCTHTRINFFILLAQVRPFDSTEGVSTTFMKSHELHLKLGWANKKISLHLYQHSLKDHCCFSCFGNFSKVKSINDHCSSTLRQVVSILCGAVRVAWPFSNFWVIA